MPNRHTSAAVLAPLLVLVCTNSSAALLSRAGGQAYYDTDQNITWLTDSNFATTNNFGVAAATNFGGLMDWDTAQSWIAGMNAANYFGVSNWRLPITVQPDPTCSRQLGTPGGPLPLQGVDYGCTGSEMGHLYYVEGISTFTAGPFTGYPDYLGYGYWSDTTFAPITNNLNAWSFKFSNGFQTWGANIASKYAWAVSPGDLLSVPIPGAAFLLPSALAALGLARRRR